VNITPFLQKTSKANPSFRAITVVLQRTQYIRIARTSHHFVREQTRGIQSHLPQKQQSHLTRPIIVRMRFPGGQRHRRYLGRRGLEAAADTTPSSTMDAQHRSRRRESEEGCGHPRQREAGGGNHGADSRGSRGGGSRMEIRAPEGGSGRASKAPPPGERFFKEKGDVADGFPFPRRTPIYGWSNPSCSPSTGVRACLFACFS